jgi:hypothetical protein
MITPAIIALATAKAVEQREQEKSRTAGAPHSEQEKQGELDTLILLLAASAIIPNGL